MHPELFELKALVAGRLDAHRRREIDDHLGSCADCSRHYVALMLGSSSPKTAEAESRQGHSSSGGGVLTFAGLGGTPDTLMYGIDAPLAAPSPRPTVARPPHSNLAALETEFVPPPSRASLPVSNSFVDAISKLRAESEQVQQTAPTAAVSAPEPATIAEPPAVAAASDLATPAARDAGTPVATEAAPELVVTFSSTPTRFARRRIATPTVTGDAALDAPYVSRAVSLPSTPATVTVAETSAAPVAPSYADAFALAAGLQATAVPFDGHADALLHEAPQASKPTSRKFGAMAVGVVLALIAAGGGFAYFQSSVSNAASRAAAAAVKEVEATAAKKAAGSAAAAAAARPPAAVPETRIVYVREPAKPEPAKAVETAAVLPPVPIAVTLPDVNLPTGTAETGANTSTQRGATSELTRSARATAPRTVNPRP